MVYAVGNLDHKELPDMPLVDSYVTVCVSIHKDLLIILHGHVLA